MSPPMHERRLVTADSRLALLHSCRSDHIGRLRIERIGELHNEHEDEHGRPSMMGRGAATGPQHLASPGHEREESDRRFARELKPWLRAAASGATLGRVCVFAPPRFLGVLCGELEGEGVELREADLTHLEAHDLESHRAVIDALS